jgi:hypothetical protein
MQPELIPRRRTVFYGFKEKCGIAQAVAVIPIFKMRIQRISHLADSKVSASIVFAA